MLDKLDTSTGKFYLEENNQMYSWLLSIIEYRYLNAKSREDVEQVLTLVGKAAAFAAVHHTGRFADGALENLLLNVATRWCIHKSAGRRYLPNRKPRQILHVASQLNYIGGHARMVARWIECDESACHSILITASEYPLSGNLANAAVKSGGRVYELESKTGILDRCDKLRALAQEVDLVILHHDGHDVIPTVALATEDLPTVIILNHADHQFWLGSSVCDLLVNLRRCAEKDMARRQITQGFLMPITLGKPRPLSARTRDILAREHKKNDIILLSIARGLKFRPAGGFDFISTAGKLLERIPNAHLYIVGETQKGLSKHLLAPAHERIHFVGEVEDPTCFRHAADVYLETFPFGSQTALLESALAGLPVVRAFAPMSSLLVADDDAINELVPAAISEQSYLDEVTRLCLDLQARHTLGGALQRQVEELHTGQSWLSKLAQLYALTDNLQHRPRALQQSTSMHSADDLALGLWQAAADVVNSSQPPLLCRLAQARHRVRIARFVDNAEYARQSAWLGVSIAPLDPLSWKILWGAVFSRTLQRWRKHVKRLLPYVSP